MCPYAPFGNTLPSNLCFRIRAPAEEPPPRIQIIRFLDHTRDCMLAGTLVYFSRLYMTGVPRTRAIGWFPAMVALIAASSFLHGGCGPSRRDLEEQAASRTALGLNSDLRNDSAFADNSLLLASCQRQLGDYDSALVSFESTIEYFHSLNDQHLERRARIALSDFYHAMHKDADAVTIASAAATSAKVFSDVGDMYRALKIVARSNHRLGRYDDEMETLADLARIDSQSYQGRERPLLLRWMMQAFDGKGDQAGADGMFNRWKEL